MYPIYIALLEKFEANKELFTKNNFEPPFIDKYIGQPLAPKEFEFMLPAIFIDYTIDWQQNILTIEAHVLDDFMEETDNLSPHKLAGLDHMRYLAICRHIINGTSAYGTNKLRPDSEKPVTTDYYYYHQQNYQARIDDLLDFSLIDPPMTDTPVDLILQKGSIVTRTPELSIPTFKQ